ncbi:MAG: hypothetical protein AAF280_11770, partial [Pseudomonadota bacterium]
KPEFFNTITPYLSNAAVCANSCYVPQADFGRREDVPKKAIVSIHLAFTQFPEIKRVILIPEHPCLSRKSNYVTLLAKPVWTVA